MAAHCCPISKSFVSLPAASQLMKVPQHCVVVTSKSRRSNLIVASSAPNSTVECPWEQQDSDLHFLSRNARIVQWYPGHIAKAEKELKAQIKLMDVIIEIRDARAPMATTHPEIDAWIGEKRKVVVLNRADMISSAEKNDWANYFAFKGTNVLFTDAKRGAGTLKLGRMVKSVAKTVNEKRQGKGLLPRAVRAVVVGYPNVGKSSLINRLLKRKKCEAAPRPGVTRELKWARIGEDLDLLDAPGVLPMRLHDQLAAIRLAICHDIGESSYAVAGVAAVFVELLKRMPNAGIRVLQERYKLGDDDMSGEEFIEELAQRLFNGDANQAASRLLQDYRKGGLGWRALELPPRD